MAVDPEVPEQAREPLVAETIALSCTPYFSEALRPAGPPPTVEQNSALRHVLQLFGLRERADDFQILESFAQCYPESPWVPSLLLNLAIAHLAQARFSRARALFRYLAHLPSRLGDRNHETIRGRALAELALIEARFGDLAEVKALLDICASRTLVGTSQEIYRHAAGVHAELVARPGKHLRCGSKALLHILRRVGAEVDPALLQGMQVDSTNGISAYDLLEVAAQAGHRFELVRRAPRAPLRTPCIVHWKVGHYSAMTEDVDGAYTVVDKSLGPGGSASVSMETIDSESSGHFLVPAGELLDGWTRVGEEEARGLFGKGDTPFDNPDATSPYDLKHEPCECQGMTVPGVSLMLVSLSLIDVPLAYSPPRGDAVRIKVVYNHREASQPTAFTFSNLGPRWALNFIDYVTDSGPVATEGMHVDYACGGGGRVSHVGYELATGTFRNGSRGSTPNRPEFMSQGILTRLNDFAWSMSLPDGRVLKYTKAESVVMGHRRVFLTSISDRNGLNPVVVRYESAFPGTRIQALVDDLGFETTFEYRLASDPLKITAIVDPYGRRADFGYTPDGSLLSSITDPIGLVSAFEYEPGTDFVAKLTTPYGETRFEAFNADTDAGASADDKAHRDRWITITTPDGEQERYEFRHETTEIVVPADDRPSNPPAPDVQFWFDWFQSRNTFHWSKKALHDAQTTFADSTIYHFMHEDEQTTGRSLESLKRPLEGRIWYRFPNQPNPVEQGTSLKPSVVARVVEHFATPRDLTPTLLTRMELFEYDHSFGLVTRYRDASGRETTYEYDKNQPLNLLFKRQTLASGNKFVLWSGTYYPNSRLLKTSAGPDGRTTLLEYTVDHQQLWRVTGPDGRVVELAYDASGFLAHVYLTHVGQRQSIDFTPDVLGGRPLTRPRQVKGIDGRAVEILYDALDRVLRVTDVQDRTYSRFEYDKLDLSASWNRLQRVTRYVSDSNRRQIAVTDTNNATTSFTWCTCGRVSTITDAAGNAIAFQYDIQGRVRAKFLPDGNYQATYGFYSKCGQVSFANDRRFVYDIDGRVSSWSHSNWTEITSIAYDDWIARPLSITREVFGIINGQPHMKSTRTLTYIDQPAIDGALRIKTEALLMDFDAYRVGTLTTNAYDSSGRLAGQQMAITEGGANSPFGIYRNFSYDDLGRLSVEDNGVGSYLYEYAGLTSRLARITETTQRTMQTEFLWFDANPRLSVIKTHTPADAPTRAHSAVGFNLDGSLNLWSFQGIAGKHYWHTVQNDANGRITGYSYDNHVVKFPVDVSGNRTDYITDGIVQKHHVYNNLNQLIRVDDMPSGTSRQLDYLGISPAAGSLSTDGKRHFDWYGTGSLMRVWYGARGGSVSEFSYDEFSRVVRTRDLDAGAVSNELIYLWMGNALTAVLDVASKTLRWEFYPQACRQSKDNIAYNWSKDHLGSVREMTTQDQMSVSKIGFEYDLWGARSTTTHLANEVPPVGFTGMLLHEKSELCLARYRVYDPSTGRWLSQDPIGEMGGINLYEYVGGMPATFTDRMGLTAPCPPTFPDTMPPGFREYVGDTWYFHCSFKVILEDRDPAGTHDPIQECAYDRHGRLVGATHTYSGCMGTPDDYSAAYDKWHHGFFDHGGPCYGLDCRLAVGSFLESMRYHVDDSIFQLNESFNQWLNFEFGGHGFFPAP